MPEGVSRKTVSKRRAVIEGLMTKAVQGDASATTRLANMALELLDAGVIEQSNKERTGAVDHAHGDQSHCCRQPDNLVETALVTAFGPRCRR